MEPTGEHSSSYWSGTVDRTSLRPEVVLPRRADVVVVGAGIMGISAAYWLARSGISVVVLEKRGIGLGATGRNAGMMLSGPSAIEDVRSLQTILGAEQIDADFQQPGHLALAGSAAILDKMMAEVARRSASVSRLQVLSRTECEALLGLRLASQFLGGRWLPSGGTIHPVRFLFGLAAASLRRGARLVRAFAVEITRAAGCLSVRCGAGSILCDSVVVACSAHTGRLVPDAAGILQPARGQVLSTAPMKRIFRFGMAVDWGTVYWRQADDGVIVLGGLRGLDPAAECSPVEELNPAIQRALANFLPVAFPEIREVSVNCRWAGIMDETPDGKPVVGEWPPGSGIWVLAGFGGHGLPPALGYARALVQAVMGNGMPVELERVNPSRFTGVRRCQ